ncbi:MAG: CDP-alcohol phosphatidyltransferase family protein [Sphaerochaetaceae bacterium]
MANLITGLKILCSILLLFFPAFSTAFYVLYLTSGVSDMVDGFVARKTNSESDFGSKLDTVADLVFVASCMLIILPEIELPVWLWIWIGVIAAIKIINIVSGYVCRKKFIAEHTLANRITGILLFLLPLTLTFIDLRLSASLVCTVATFASIQEGHLIRTGR